MGREERHTKAVGGEERRRIAGMRRERGGDISCETPWNFGDEILKEEENKERTGGVLTVV